MIKRRRLRREFTAEQKAQAVEDYLTSGESMYAVAKRLKINYGNLYRWVALTRDSNSQSALRVTSQPQQHRQPEPATTSLCIEVENLRRANERLANELEAYKITTAYLAKEYFMRSPKITV